MPKTSSLFFSEIMHKNQNHKIWDKSVAPFQNGSHFKLSRLNLLQPNSNSVKIFLIELKDC